MICGPCRNAADLADGRLFTSGEPDPVIYDITLTPRPIIGHEMCEGDTWCDCQHRPTWIEQSRA